MKPVYPHRGAYMESSWGPDLMGLPDWKEMIDYLAGLGLNVLGVGLYGCWNAFFQEQLVETLMVPLRGHPRLETPRSLRYYSPSAAAFRTLAYRPRMFERDFLGDVVAHGRERGMLVFPTFNSHGHNTLMPRVYPDVSSVDAEGRPNGYGYCLRSRATYDLLFDLYGQIVDRYLKPNGVRWFCLGLDEVVPVANINASDRRRVVDPWCRCPACRQRTDPENFLGFVVRLTRFLVDRGMAKVMVFHDQFEQFGMFRPALVRRLRRERLLDHVVFCFWDYEDRGRGVFVDLHPELDIHRWVMPMTCCFNWLSFQSKVDNIWGLTARGRAAGAEGVMSYSFFDWAWSDHFYHLSLAAADTGRVTRAQADVEYARRTFGARWRGGMTGLKLLDDYGGLVSRLVDKGLTPAALRKELGRDKRLGFYARERMLSWVESARDLFAGLEPRAGNRAARSTRRALWAESVRSRNLLEEALILGRALPGRPSARDRGRCLKLHMEIMRAMEETKPHYVVPSTLAYLTPAYEYLAGLKA